MMRHSHTTAGRSERARSVVLLAAPLLVAAAGTVVVAHPLAAQTPDGPPVAAANPDLAASCGLDITLVLDASQSIDDPNLDGDRSDSQVAAVRAAVGDFLGRLQGTGSRVNLLQFASESQTLVEALTPVTAETIATTFSSAVDAYVNPDPPLTRPARSFSGDGTVATNSERNDGDLWLPTDTTVYTNWDSALARALALAQQPGNTPDLVVFFTDGDPTAMDWRATNVSSTNDGGGTPRGGADRAGEILLYGGGDAIDAAGNLYDSELLYRPMLSANALKALGVKVLMVGAGAVSGAGSVSNLVDISGPDVLTSGIDATTIGAADVILPRDDSQIAASLVTLATALCSNPPPPAAPAADLQIVKDVSATAVTPGQPITYTLRVRNNGPSDAADVVVTDPAAAGFVLQAASAGRFVCTNTGSGFSCSLPSLAAGAEESLSITAQVDAAAVGGQVLVNVGSVTSSTPDSNPANNSDDATSTVLVGELPSTGTGVGGWFAAAMLCLAGGGVLLLVGRPGRRRTTG